MANVVVLGFNIHLGDVLKERQDLLLADDKLVVD